MGIKKIISGNGDIDITHDCAVQQSQGKPIAIIFDENKFHKTAYDNLAENPDLETNINPMIVRSTQGHVLVAHIALRSKDEILEFTIQPSIEFMEIFRNTKSIVFIIEEIQYGFTAYDLYTKDCDDMIDKYVELKREETSSL